MRWMLTAALLCSGSACRLAQPVTITELCRENAAVLADRVVSFPPIVGLGPGVDGSTIVDAVSRPSMPMALTGRSSARVTLLMASSSVCSVPAATGSTMRRSRSPRPVDPNDPALSIEAAFRADIAGLNPCPADTNGNGVTDPGDFTVWVSAFNLGLPQCDQNGNGFCDPGDFTVRVAGYDQGC